MIAVDPTSLSLVSMIEHLRKSRSKDVCPVFIVSHNIHQVIRLYKKDTRERYDAVDTDRFLLFGSIGEWGSYSSDRMPYITQGRSLFLVENRLFSQVYSGISASIAPSCSEGLISIFGGIKADVKALENDCLNWHSIQNVSSLSLNPYTSKKFQSKFVIQGHLKAQVSLQAYLDMMCLSPLFIF